MVHSGILFVLFCTVNWLFVEKLNIEEGELTSEVGAQPPAPSFKSLGVSKYTCRYILRRTKRESGASSAAGETPRE